MESDRFDDLTKRLVIRQSRRGALGRLGRAVAGATLAALGLGTARGEAQVLLCAADGCRCRPGALDSCIPGLVCCANDSNLQGGAGTCVAPSQCFGGLCSGDAVVCPVGCTWGRNCAGCCSGYCGDNGLCGPGPCRSAGCACISGALAPCEDGLACCPTIAGLPGGPGFCVPRGICN